MRLLLSLPALAAALVLPAHADTLTPEQRELLTTATEQPRPSPALVQALELDVAPWHKVPADPSEPRVKLPPEAIREATEAALAALNALPPSVLQNDFDRAWVAYEKASALAGLERKAEAKAAFEALREMPRTMIQDRYALIALNGLGETGSPGWCVPGKLMPSSTRPEGMSFKIDMTRSTAGWVQPFLDIAADGSISHVSIYGSSARAFEQPVIDALRKEKFRTASGEAPGRPCFAMTKYVFMMNMPRTPSEIVPADNDTAFTYRSIGAAIRIRGAAREAARAEARANAQTGLGGK